MRREKIKNKRLILAFCIMLVSILFVGCSGFLKIVIDEKGEGNIAFSILLNHFEDVKENSSFESREELHEYISELFPLNTFEQRENLDGIKFTYSDSFTSLKELGEKLRSIKLAGSLSLFKDIKTSEEASSDVYISLTTENLKENGILNLNEEVLEKLSLNIEITMPYIIDEYIGGEKVSDYILLAKLNDFSKENVVHVYSKGIDEIESNTINIIIDKENKGKYEWYISEFLENESYSTPLASQWGFNKFETEDETIVYYMKSEEFDSLESLSDGLMKLTRNSNPLNKEFIFKEFTIDKLENGEIKIIAQINNLDFKTNLRLNITLPTNIIESKGGYLDRDNIFTCFVKDMESNNLFVNSDSTEKETLKISKMEFYIVVGSIILFNILIILIVVIVSKKTNKAINKLN